MGESTKYLLIGGGIASVSAAKAIRERDTEGSVMIVTADPYMPYDRPPLSKGFLSDDTMSHDDVSSKFDHWYPDNKIDVKTATHVKGIDRRNHFAILDNGEHITYEKLLIATGSHAARRNMGEPGDSRIVTLRSIQDAIALRNALHGAKKVVVVGSGFLGPEVASQCAKLGIETTIVSHGAHIWDQFASAQLGAFLNSSYEQGGIQLVLGQKIDTIYNGELITDKQYTIKADLFLLAVGVDLNYQLAENCGIGFLPNEGVKVSEMLQSYADPDIYAAGDVAYFHDMAMDRQWHLEHHLNAQWTGAAAGANMAGANVPYRQVPYFFSDFLDLHMILRGKADSADFTTVLGNMVEGEFIELYADPSGILRMGISISHTEKKLDPISDKLEELITAKVKAADVSLADFPSS